MKNKFSINRSTLAFASLLLAAVLLSGCSAETKQEITMWWNQLANTMTKGELFLVIIFGSFIGSSFSR